MTETSSLASYAASLEALAPATHRVPLVLHGDVYIVRCDDPTLAETLRRYFAPFVDEDVDASSAVEICAYQRTPPTFDDAELITPPLGRGTKRLKEQYVDRADGRFVLKTRTGMVFGFGGGRNVAVGPCDENPNQVINFINNRLMSRALDDGAVLTHAAAIARGDAAIAIAGFSGMGKSTTALHLMNAPGTAFISNDRLLLRRVSEGEVSAAGVPKHPRINPGTALHNPSLAGIIPPKKAAHLRALPPEELWELEDKYDAIIDDCFGPDRFRLTASLSAFVVLNWRTPGAPLRVETCSIASRADLLDAIMKGPGLFHHAGQEIPTPTPADYLPVLHDIPIVEFSGGPDFDAATRVCLELLAPTPGRSSAP